MTQRGGGHTPERTSNLRPQLCPMSHLPTCQSTTYLITTRSSVALHSSHKLVNMLTSFRTRLTFFRSLVPQTRFLHQSVLNINASPRTSFSTLLLRSPQAPRSQSKIQPA